MKRTSLFTLTTLLIVLTLAACRGAPPPPDQTTNTQPVPPTSDGSVNTASMVNIKADVWADNWFAFYLADQLIKEDSVSITTERSFNAETFTFAASYPMTFNFIAKDFKENDTGLEYIGTNRQQMGDGGLIAQFINADTGEVIAVTDSNWMCTVIHEAPLDKACETSANPVAGEMPCGFTSLEEPANWMDAAFDTSAWAKATIYSAGQVDPKDGFEQIAWDPSAQFIWGPDLETNNTLLCKLTING